MNNDSLIPEEAVENFLNTLLESVFKHTLEDMKILLEQGPPGQKPAQAHLVLNHWFKNLGESDREHVLNVIHEAVKQTLFSMLVLLDNMMIGNPVKDLISDYALYVQTYDDIEAKHRNLSSASVRLNFRHSRNDEELHDKFMYMILENARNG
jgi:hypothetical protein